MLAIFNREVKRLLKQPKVIFSTFLVPCALILLMMWFFMSDVLTHEKKDLAIVTEDKAYMEEFLAANEDFKDVLIYTEETEELMQLYDSGDVDIMLVLDFDTKTAEVRYDATKLKTGDNLLLSQRLVRELAMYCSSEELYQNYVAQNLEIMQLDTASERDLWEQSLASLVGIFTMVFVFLVGQPMATFSIDAYVGERERGSYDSIRLAGIDISKFLLGKILFVTVIGLIAGGLQIGCALGGLGYFEPEMNVLKYVDNPVLFWSTLVITCGISLMILVAVMVYLSTYFETVKDAGMYASLGTIAFTALTQVSAISASELWSYIPFANLSEMILGSATGTLEISKLLISTIFGMAVVAVLIFLSVKQLEHKEQ